MNQVAPCTAATSGFVRVGLFVLKGFIVLSVAGLIWPEAKTGAHAYTSRPLLKSEPRP